MHGYGLRLGAGTRRRKRQGKRDAMGLHVSSFILPPGLGDARC
jgi:hypothetical protein